MCSDMLRRTNGYDVCSRNLLDRWRRLRTHTRRSLSTLIERQLPIPADSTRVTMCDNAQYFVRVAALYVATINS